MKSGFNVEEIVRSILDKLKSLESIVDCAVACVSGGLDSTTSALLAKLALRDKVHAIFVDTGFMRLGEAERVKNALKDLLDIEIHNRSEYFISKLEGLSDAEEKRLKFRDLFYKTIGEIVLEKKCSWVVQGTIKADVVETTRGVKTQHNVLNQELIRKYGFNVVEPLVDFYKHEVRAIARYLGLPKWLIERQPFPGPGLLIRSVGRLTRDKLELVRNLTNIVEEFFENRGFSQYFPAVWENTAISIETSNDIKAEIYTVKVTGVFEGKRSYGHPVVVKQYPPSLDIYELYKHFDTRTYPHILVEVASRSKGEYIAALRVVETLDYMTAKVPKLDVGELKKLSEKILEETSVVSVVFDVTPKPPATIEFE